MYPCVSDMFYKHSVLLSPKTLCSFLSTLSGNSDGLSSGSRKCGGYCKECSVNQLLCQLTWLRVESGMVEESELSCEL